MRAIRSTFLALIFAVAKWRALAPTSLSSRTAARFMARSPTPADKQAASYVISTDGGGKVTIPRTEVARVVSQSPAQEEYHRRALAVADTVDAHWQLAQWCREQKLVDEYREQLTKILELDPNHEQARLALGHQKKNGSWQSRDEVMAARGMVWYDGKYYTQHHVELLGAGESGQADRRRLEQPARSLATLAHRPAAGRSTRRCGRFARSDDPAAAPAVVVSVDERRRPGGEATA